MTRMMSLTCLLCLTAGIAWAEKHKTDRAADTLEGPLLAWEPIPLPLNTAVMAQAKAMPEAFSTRTYAVGDLLAKPEIVPAGAFGEVLETQPTRRPRTPERIRDFVQSHLPATSWRGQGGSGNIDYHPQSQALVVYQTPSNQVKIAQALDALRGEQEQQISYQLHLLTVSDDCYRRFELEKMLGERRLKQMTGDQFRSAMKNLQSDPETRILSSPTVISMSGEKAELSVGSQQMFVTEYRISNVRGEPVIQSQSEPHFLGLNLSLTGKVRDDGKIQVICDGTMNELKSTVKEIPFKGIFPGNPYEVSMNLQLPVFVLRNLDRELTIDDSHVAIYSAGVGEFDRPKISLHPELAKVPLLKALTLLTQKEKNHLLVVMHVNAIKPGDLQPQVLTVAGDSLDRLAVLMLEYRKACREGDTTRAKLLADKCLEIDPTCFWSK